MITLSQAKAQCRVRHSEEDALISGYVLAARDWIEKYTRIIVEQREVVDRFNAFDEYLILSRSPVVEVTEVSYTDAAGGPQTVSDYQVQDGKVYPPAAGWPSTQAYTSVEVAYDAGYGPYDEFPEALNLAMLLLVTHWYDNRSAVDSGNVIPREIPLSVEALAGPYRLPVLS